MQSKKLVVKPKLSLITYSALLSGFSSDSSLSGKFNDNGKSDTSFWIEGVGSDINHIITDSQEAEITDSQEAEIFKLAETGIKYTDIAQKLGISAVGVYYVLKGSKRKKKSKKPRSTSILCTFDKKGNLIADKGGSIETTVRVSKGLNDDPLLFFILRDSYSRVDGARFVIAGCNGRQFDSGFVARVVVGVPQET